MEKTSISAALFAGTRFDRKRFAGDIARFRKGGQPSGPVPAPAPDAAQPSPEKKRKRKSKNNAKKIKKKKNKRAEGPPSGEISVPGCLVSDCCCCLEWLC
jgi:ATP-dependent RNA helicase DDX52/ROK1